MKNMKTARIKLNLQIISKQKSIPTISNFKYWVTTALRANTWIRPYRIDKSVEITIRVINAKEMSELNQKYRHKSGPTNILSFPFSPPPGIKSNLLGDIIICAPIVKQEAKRQNKLEKNHWAHLTIHGVLHLLGYDHTKSKDAKKMEQLEIKILKQLGIDDPYFC
jgi:probable rRNA maturation factor